MTDNPLLAPPPGDLRGDEPPAAADAGARPLPTHRCVSATSATRLPSAESQLARPGADLSCGPWRAIDRARYVDATSAWTGSIASNKSRSVRTGSPTDPVARQAT